MNAHTDTDVIRCSSPMGRVLKRIRDAIDFANRQHHQAIQSIAECFKADDEKQLSFNTDQLASSLLSGAHAQSQTALLLLDECSRRGVAIPEDIAKVIERSVALFGPEHGEDLSRLTPRAGSATVASSAHILSSSGGQRESEGRQIHPPDFYLQSRCQGMRPDRGFSDGPLPLVHTGCAPTPAMAEAHDTAKDQRLKERGVV